MSVIHHVIDRLKLNVSNIEGVQSIRPILDLERVLPLYDLYDAFASIVWCRNRGVDKNQTFLQENVNTLRTLVGY
ncbi:hypothetical protein MKX42_32695 [Paenibacillus sp. FSL R7-0204]|uniref:hypothetical protein n=1 Tax=Paenibacillus sp. FSL R7-0204 TaxID=2921675 RepID=UPI0030F5266B